MSDPISAPLRPPPPGFQLPQRSVGLKLLVVCALALLMAIPSLFVLGMVRERSMGAQSAISEVSQAVGGNQTALGPVIAVPYSWAPDPKHPDRIEYALAYAYAETGSIDANATVTERTRSIHKIPVFDAQTTFTAEFDPATLRSALPRNASPLWANARLYMGISDARGLQDDLNVTINGKRAPMEPISTQHVSNPQAFRDRPHFSGLALAGTPMPQLETLTAPLKVTANTRFTGAEHLTFPPFAKDTSVKLSSDWTDPSFQGSILPKEHNADDNAINGFTASWRVPYIARGVAGSGRDLRLDELTSHGAQTMSVRFMVDVSPYQSVERALKYSIMFVGFVFLAYFLFEVSSSGRAHPAQYVLVGLTQTIFYILLLALAERIGFDFSFLIAATMTVTLTSAYAMSVFDSRAYGFRALGILTGIYGLVYVLMRAEDHALLAGAFASFAAIAITMYMTRNIDWYGNRNSSAGA